LPVIALGQVLVYSSFYPFSTQLAWASENEKLLAQQENLLVQNDEMALLFINAAYGYNYYRYDHITPLLRELPSTVIKRLAISRNF